MGSGSGSRRAPRSIRAARPRAGSSTAGVSYGSRSDGVRGRSGRGASGRGGASTSQGLNLGPGRDTWNTWWQHNRDAFLWDLPSAPAPRGPVTSAGSELSIARPRTTAGVGPSRADVYTRVVPALLDQLAQSQDAEVLAEAALALGRVVRAPFDGPAVEAIVPLLAHDDQNVARAGAIALGLMDTDAGLDPLLELAACTQLGHRLVGENSVPDDLRAFAALAVGLAGSPRSTQLLMDLAEGGSDADDQLRAGAILALGLLEPEATAEAAPWLQDRSDDRRLPLALQVSLATSLGRTGSGDAVQHLLQVLEDRDSDPPTRQAAVAALGRAATLADQPAIDALIERVEESRDAGTRQLALLSLGRLSTGEAGTPLLAKRRGAIDGLLRSELRHASHAMDRPFAALAAGLALRQRADLHGKLDAALLDAYDNTGDPAQRGAFALALGLGRVTDASRSLRRDLGDTHDDALSGHLAVALGLLGDQEAAPALRAALVEAGQPQELRENLATALRLLGDEDAVETTRAAYAKAGNSVERNGLAAALASLRHADGLESLLATCADKRQSDGDRAAACAALGRLAESSPQPFTARLTRDDAPAFAYAPVEALLRSR